MYNFLDPKLLPKVGPVPGALEGYEASNLISENPLIKSRGFVTYSCIKPPVNIDFELICPVSINYISVNCKIGTQRITGIELQAKTDTKNSEFTTIGKAFMEEDKVLFCNSRYYTKEKAKRISESVYVAFLKSHLFRIFINAKFIRVRILRTERSTPGLGPVEIWGSVSKLCPKMTVQTIEKLMLKRNCDYQKNNHTPNSFYASEIKQTDGIDSNEFEISDDFKDALTFEVMALPMTLPSGHTVDQSTLERCAKNDAMYGRKFSDPFTGLPFTDNRKPKLNTALKNRIDMFLLQHGHRKETYGIARTVGSKNFNTQNVDVNVYHNLNNKRTYNAIEECQATTSNHQHYKKAKTACDTNFKKENIISQSNCDGTQKSENNSIDSSLDNAMAKVINGKNFVTFTKENGIGKSNESVVDNLDETIANVMNSTNFVRFTKEAEVIESKFNTKMCSCCMGDSILYSLPCKHIYCKDCLLNVCESLVCSKCGCNFCKKDVVRIHNS